jgi:hypothetical protein
VAPLSDAEIGIWKEMIHRKIVIMDKSKGRLLLFTPALHFDTSTQNNVRQYHGRITAYRHGILRVKDRKLAYCNKRYPESVSSFIQNHRQYHNKRGEVFGLHLSFISIESELFCFQNKL